MPHPDAVPTVIVPATEILRSLEERMLAARSEIDAAETADNAARLRVDDAARLLRLAESEIDALKHRHLQEMAEAERRVLTARGEHLAYQGIHQAAHTTRLRAVEAWQTLRSIYGDLAARMYPTPQEIRAQEATDARR